MARSRPIIVKIGQFFLVFLVLIITSCGNKSTKCKMIQGFFKVKQIDFNLENWLSQILFDLEDSFTSWPFSTTIGQYLASFYDLC